MQNLDTFYSVKRPIDKYAHLFLEYQKADELRQQWKRKYTKDLRESENNLSRVSYVRDEFNNLSLAVSTDTSYDPGFVCTQPAGSTNSDTWVNCPGYEKIRWGRVK
jgi:hypothetical protein